MTGPSLPLWLWKYVADAVKAVLSPIAGRAISQRAARSAASTALDEQLGGLLDPIRGLESHFSRTSGLLDHFGPHILVRPCDEIDRRLDWFVENRIHLATLDDPELANRIQADLVEAKDIEARCRWLVRKRPEDRPDIPADVVTPQEAEAMRDRCSRLRDAIARERQSLSRVR